MASVALSEQGNAHLFWSTQSFLLSLSQFIYPSVNPSLIPSLHSSLHPSIYSSIHLICYSLSSFISPSNLQLKLEVYTFKLSFSQFLKCNPRKKFPVLGHLGSPLYFKNVKVQNNSREKDLLQLLFLSSHSQWVRSLHTHWDHAF